MLCMTLTYQPSGFWLGLWDACPERGRVKTHDGPRVGVAQAPEEETANGSGAH